MFMLWWFRIVKIVIKESRNKKFVFIFIKEDVINRIEIYKQLNIFCKIGLCFY